MLRTREQLLELAREGVRNLLYNCAEVKAEQLVVLVNDESTVDPAVSSLMEEAIQAKGARSKTVWVPQTTGGSPADQGLSLSADQIAALLSADTIINSINPPLLARYLSDAGKSPLMVISRPGTLEQMASGLARYHWGLVQVIRDVLSNDIFPVGSQWRITTPSGTDLRGVTGDIGLRALYAEDEANQRRAAGRSLTTTAYIPVTSTEAEGVIAVEWLNGSAMEPAYDPPFLDIRHNQIADIQGGLNSDQWVKEYWTATEKLVQRFGDKALVVDSWHGGMNPWAGNLRPSWVSGTRHVHFHMGRTTGKPGDFCFADIQSLSVEVDGKPVYDMGKLAMLDHPKVRAAAERFGVEDWKEVRPRTK